MSVIRKFDLTWTEILTTGLIIGGALFAITDGVRLLNHGAETSWTGKYIIFGGTAMALLAIGPLVYRRLNFHRLSVDSSISSDIISTSSAANEEEPVLDEELDSGTAIKTLSYTIVLLIAWILMLLPFGYSVSTLVFVFLYDIVVSRRSIIKALILSVVFSGSTALIFLAIGINLPQGSLF